MGSLLETELFKWESGDVYSIANSLQSTLIMGETGSAKTTSSFSLLAANYLDNGYGILALTCKEEETKRWQTLCRKFDREDDLVIFGPNSGHCYNFFDAEVNREDSGKGITHNIADVLKTVIKSGNEDGGENDKAFWDSSLQQLLVNSIDLCLLTKNHKFEHVYQIVQSAPRTGKELASLKWRNNSKCFRAIQHIAQFLQSHPESEENAQKTRRLKSIEDFFLGSWLYLSEKTRSIVEQMFFGFGDRFMREPVYSLFNNQTTIKPEDTLRGKVIVIDLPYLIYDKTGQDVQILWKFLWQRAMQRRQINPVSRPCALFIDEFQVFFSENDPQFQSTCRSYRACSVLATQNMPNFFLNAGGGERGRTRFKALAGNMSTKFFHCNSDPETNEYAADLIGKDWQWSSNEGQTYGEKMSFSSGQAESLMHLVEPSEFTKLKTGGYLNNFQAEAVVHRQGRVFRSTGSNYKKVTLKQMLL